MTGVTRWSIDRGRSYELDKTATGTATFTIADTDGTYDPTNPGSPFAGQLDPMKQAAIALTNPVTSTASTLFRGFTAGWHYDMDITERVCFVTVDCVDAFELFSALEMTPTNAGTNPPAGSEGDIYFDGMGGEYNGTTDHIGPDDRINAALDDANWSATLRNIFSGNVALQETVYARRDALLSVMQDTADAEFPGVSNLYMSRDGKVRFRGRFARFNPSNPTYGINTWDAGDMAACAGNSGVAPISSLQFARDSSNLINACLALPQGVQDTDVPGSLVTDSVSIGLYGFRSRTFDNLLTYKGEEAGGRLTAVQETKQVAQYYVDNYKDPRTRVGTITFRPLNPAHFNGPALWALMCGVEIGDLLHLTTAHPGGGGFDEDFFIEGIHYDALPMNADYPEVTLTLDLSPRAYFTSGFFPDQFASPQSTRVSQAPQSPLARNR